MRPTAEPAGARPPGRSGRDRDRARAPASPAPRREEARALPEASRPAPEKGPTRPLDAAIHFPAELPISARVREIAAAIEQNAVVIVAGETGSGKTTQLPKICLAMGRGRAARIGVTQPRRIAATSVAARVAGELGVELGREVGVHIRFSDRTCKDTHVKFMTDGVLLAEIQGDPLLRAYDTILLDEAHERSLNVDFLLGHLHRILPSRPDLRVIVSSATLATERFSAFFGGAPVISVSGRTFPVQVIHRPLGARRDDVAEAIADTVEDITARDPRGDILVFLPGEREIRATAAALVAHALPHTIVLPLHGRLSQAEQARIFQRASQRRIVLATNVAETSLTIPGIVYVIDTGLARVQRQDPRTGVTSLLVEPISRASADQRKGRAGRVQSGVCFRLFSREDFDARPAHTDPEIFRVGLAGAILQMKSIGLGELSTFPFLDAPPKRAIEEGYRLLEELGALDEARALTELGKKLARLPVDPRVGRMILAGEQEGALREVLIIAAGLGAQDPRERPLAAQQRADEAHAKFRDDGSDFGALLKIWQFFQAEQEKKPQAQVRKACSERFLSFARLTEWADVHHQLSRIARELGFAQNDAPASPEAVHRALLPGLLSRVGAWNAEQRVFIGARGTRFQLHPSSALVRTKPVPPFVMAAELVETSQLFARMAAKIDPAWLEPAGGALCKRTYGDPHWAAKPAQVMSKEQVTLFGIPIVRDRKVHYGPLDPKASRRLFLLHALVRGEYAPAKPPPFMEHNRALFEQVRKLRDRARKSDMIADDHAVALFFEKRIPDHVYSGHTFEQWRTVAEAEDPRVLHLSLGDVLLDDRDEVTPERFPDALEVAGAVLPLSYRFDPGEDDDGITLTVPLTLLPALDAGMLEWTIPGWRREKIEQLCHALPRSARDAIGKVDDLAHGLAARLAPGDGPMLPVVARALSEASGVHVTADAFDLGALSPHLRFFVRVVDEGRRLGEGRDLRDLQERFGARARARSNSSTPQPR